MKLNKTIVAASLAAVLCTTASAASIAVRFGDQDNQDFAGGSLIGPTGIDGANWNNTSSQDLGANNYGNGTFAAGTVIDDSGAIIAATTITFSSPNTYWNGAGTGSDEAKLLVTYLDDGGSGSSVTVTNHGYAQYDLYVITTGDAGNGSGGTATFTNTGFTVNGVDQGAHDGLGYNGLTLVEAVGGVGGTAGNWVKYTGFTGDLTITSNSPSGGRSPFNGFVIVEVPEPSSTALLGLGGIALILRRRK